MKRIKIFVIVFAALCTLTACGAQQEQTVARNLYAVHLLPDAGDAPKNVRRTSGS